MDSLKFYLMRKNDLITYVVMSPDGNMLKYSSNIFNEELAPIQDRYQTSWLKEWWKERSIPIDQDGIDRYLKSHGYRIPSEYLIKNLGLSLTDYYWIKPDNSDITWEDVNLFDNAFSDNLFDHSGNNEENSKIPHYSPNSTLQGRIEKSWMLMDGERYLVKGNRSNLSSESINEVIACKIHELQGFTNYVKYELISIKGTDYDYGCRSKLFTSQQTELVSAFAIFTHDKQSNNTSSYNHFINECKKLGAYTEELESELGYQIMVDYIMSGYDRHLNNIGMLRDADSLKFKGLAPIFDSGAAFFANKMIPKNEKDLFDIKTYGFATREYNLLKLVKDRNVLDLSKLPPASYIREMYGLDSQNSQKNINNIAYWYEKKIELCRKFQLGKDISPVSVGVIKPSPNNNAEYEQKISNIREKIEQMNAMIEQFLKNPLKDNLFANKLEKIKKDVIMSAQELIHNSQSFGKDEQTIREDILPSDKYNVLGKLNHLPEYRNTNKGPR